MSTSATITGIGLTTALGRNVDQTWRALLAGEFIRTHSRVPTDCNGDRVSHLACSAASECLGNAGWGAQMLSDPATALVIGTSKGPVEKWLLGEPRITGGDSCSYGLADLTTAVARSVGHGAGPRAALSAACASGIHALIHAILLLRSGVARQALVVAAEASVHPLFIGSFQRLGVLPREGAGCRPFDANRDGFLMSEAAAAICLESREDARGYARVDRFALGADATHLTGGDPQGRTLKHLLNHVIKGRPVDLVHAHATGTTLHDPIELEAIELTLPPSDPAPSVYSHKGALGHSLGAAGLVSVALNCMSHWTGIVPPNVRTEHPLPTQSVTISRESTKRTVSRSLAIASGFGGAIGIVSLVS